MTVTTTLATLAMIAGIAAHPSASAWAQPPAQPTPAVIRLGIAPPAVTLGEKAPGDAGLMVSEALASLLEDSSLEVVLLSARQAAQHGHDNGATRLDFVLFTTVTRQQHNSRWKTLGKVAGTVAGAAIPGGQLLGTAARLTAAAASVSGTIKGKDELTLTYRLVAADASERAAATLTKTASRSGEDLLTPMTAEMVDALLPVMAGMP